MPFGMSWDEFRRSSRAAQGGDAEAAARVIAGSGLHITKGAKIALGVAGAAALPTLLPLAANLVPRAGRLLPSLSDTMMSLQPGTTPGPLTNSLAWQGESGNSGWGAATVMGCNLIPQPAIRAACLAFTGGGGGNGAGPQLAPARCPPGYRDTPNGCQIEGMGGYLPGDIGRQDFGWQSTLGRYGAGYTPILVQRNARVCPAGSKLGKDGVCYDRIARTNRMHNPGARPFMTGGQVQTIRRAKALQKRGRKLMQSLMPAARKCAPTKKRKR